MADKKEEKTKTEKVEKKQTTSAKEKPVKKEKPPVQKKEKKQPKQEKVAEADAKTVADAFNVIKFVLMTEKSVRMVESQNKLVFIVNRSAARNEIKRAVQNAFGTAVTDVKTVIDQSGRKKAYVKFSNPGAAGDIAIKLGII